MTILDLDKTSVPRATSTPKKVEICCGGEKGLASQTPETLQSELSLDGSSKSASICSQRGSVSSLDLAGDNSDDVHRYGERLCADYLTPLPAVLHDHCYTEKVPEWAVSSPPADDSSLDESLQNLFDTCDVDPVFLAEAKPAFQQFLDDVMNSSDVPDDVMFFNVDDSDCHVPTKSSSCLTNAPSTPCLFTCAGSTETRLSSSLAATHNAAAGTPFAFSVTSSTCSSTSPALTSCVWSSPTLPPPPQLAMFHFSSPSLPFCSSVSYQASSSSRSSSSSSGFFPSSSDISSMNNEVLEALSSLAPESDSQSHAESVSTSTNALTNLSDVASFFSSFSPLTAGDVALCSAKQPLWDLDDSAPVTMSHRIQNGVCVFCSPAVGGHSAKDADERVPHLTDDSAALPARHNDVNNNDSSSNNNKNSHSTTSPTPAGHVQLSSHPSASSFDASCRKRKSEEECESLACKQTKLEDHRDVFPGSGRSATLGEVEGKKCCDVGDAVFSAAKEIMQLPSSRLGEKQQRLSMKPRGRVLECLSFVVKNDEKLSDFHPLSPINVNQFGRCG